METQEYRKIIARLMRKYKKPFVLNDMETAREDLGRYSHAYDTYRDNFDIINNVIFYPLDDLQHSPNTKGEIKWL